MKFATKPEDLHKLCPELEGGLRCIDAYTQVCLAPEQRAHFHRLYAGTRMVLEEICRPGHFQDEFLRHAPCMNKLTSEYEQCVFKYQTELHNISVGLQQEPEELTKMCGNLHDLLSCSKNIVNKECGEETARFAAGFLDKMADSLIQRHCAETGAAEPRALSFPLLLLLCLLAAQTLNPTSAVSSGSAPRRERLSLEFRHAPSCSYSASLPHTH